MSGSPSLPARVLVGDRRSSARVVRDDRRYEQTMLDKHGLPIEWHTVYQPDLN